MRKRFKFFIGVFLLCIVACGEKSETDSSSSHQSKDSDPISNDSSQLVEDSEAKMEKTPIDTSANQVANFLAGTEHWETDSSKMSASWLQYSHTISNNWEQLDNKRLNTLINWSKERLSQSIVDSLPLFYPFSGPDFLHAYYLYPEASDYTLIALEKVYPIPDVLKMDEGETKTFLSSMERSLRDILSKSYFITTHMMEDLTENKADGVLPLFYTFLVKTGHEIVDVCPIEVDSTGSIYRHDSLSYEANQAVQFKFRKKGTEQIKTLSYFSRSISDRDLEQKHPNFLTFLQNKVPHSNAFVKAASYLMHYKGFGIVRDAVLSSSDCIFQDDTGVPLRYIDTDAWDITLFGDYTRPIKNFSNQMYQSDLNDLYDQTHDKEELPFSFGYHIVGDKIQNHQIFKRK